MASEKMNDMPGMNRGDPSRAQKNSDPTTNQKGMDTPAPPIQAPGPRTRESMMNMPMISPKRVWTATGTEDWTMLSGFGKAAGMVAMMNGMMVGGGPMQSMKMGKMDMSMADALPPTPEEARLASGQAAPPASESAQAALADHDQPAKSQQPSAASAVGPLTLKATLAPNPPKVGGGNAMTVTVTDSAGKPVIGAQVTSTVAMVTMDMGTTHPAFKDIGGGKYQGDVAFGMAGPWSVTVKVAAPGQPPATKTFQFNAK